MTPIANVQLSGDAEYWKARAEKAEAENENLRNDAKYPDPEDMPGELAAKYCPFKDPLHFHHDGCPSEWAVERAYADKLAGRP